MILKKKMAAILGVILLVSMLSSFLPSVTVRAQSGEETVTFAWLSDVSTLNPLTYSSDWEEKIVSCIYDKLWEFDPDTLMPVPWIAYQWTMADTVGEYWRVRIRNNVTFHDGVSLTTEHIAFTYWFIKYSDFSSFPEIPRYLKNVTIEDAYTFTIRLEATLAPFPVGMNPWILPEHEWKDYVVNWGGSVAATPHPWIIDNSSVWAEDLLDAKAPMGCGPFEFLARIPADYIELEKNDDYWYAGYPKAEKLVMKIISNPSDQIDALKNGSVDIMGVQVPLDQVASLESDPTVDLFKTDGQGYRHLSFNFRYWPFNLTSFRRAVRTMINTSRIVDEFLQGYGTPGTVNVPPALGYWFYNVDSSDYPWLTSVGNLTLAGQILQNDGWYDTDGDGKFDTWDQGQGPLTLSGAFNGTEWPTGIAISLPDDDDVIADTGVMICSALEELFDVAFISDPVNTATLTIRAYYTNAFDMFIWDYALGVDPWMLLRVFHSSSAGFLGTENCFPILNGTLDGAIDFFSNTSTGHTQFGKFRQEWGWEVQKILIEQGPQWALYYRQYVQAYRKDQVEGLVEMPTGILEYLGWHKYGYLTLEETIPSGALNTWTFRNVYGDLTPPAAITDLAASNPTVNSITLRWSAPGDDGNVGNAAGYIVKYSTSGPINDSNWDSAMVYDQSWTPLSAGNYETHLISGLINGTTYWFAIKAYDEVPNYSGISNSPSGTPGEGGGLPIEIIVGLGVIVGAVATIGIAFYLLRIRK